MSASDVGDYGEELDDDNFYNTDVLTEKEISRLNGIIDKDLIVSDKKDGTCVYGSILNGIYYKKFKAVRREDGEFERCCPEIYKWLHVYEKELKFRKLADVLDTVEEINEKLLEYGYCINIYERRRQYYLVDRIETQKQTFKKLISFVKTMYSYCHFQPNTDVIHLMFEKLENFTIHDMVVLKDISRMFRFTQSMTECQKRPNNLTRRVFVCDKCVCAFVRFSTFKAHCLWCKVRESTHYTFKSDVALNTFQPHIKNIESLPFTIYYDLDNDGKTHLEC